MRAVLLQFLCSEAFTYPSDSQTLMRQLRIAHKHCDGRTMMKSFNAYDFLVELQDKEAVKLEPISIGTLKAMLIIDVNREKLQQLNRESSKDRPKPNPPGERSVHQPSAELRHSVKRLLQNRLGPGSPLIP